MLGFDPSYSFCISENIMVQTFNTAVFTTLYCHKHNLNCRVFSIFYHGKLTVDELTIQILFIFFLLGSQEVGKKLKQPFLLKLCLSQDFLCLVSLVRPRCRSMKSKGHRLYQEKCQIPCETNPEVRNKMDHFLSSFGNIEQLGSPVIVELLCNLIRDIVT